MAKETKTQEEAAFDFSQDAGLGLEGMTAKDMALPFLSILQKLSPQVDESKGKYIQGAKPGLIFNTVTEELSSQLTFIVTGYKRLYPEWKDREAAGGGFVMMHSSNDILEKCSPNKKGLPALPSGNVVIDTAYYFGLVLRPDEMTEPAVISMSSTQWTVARKLNSLLMRDLLPSGQVAPAYRKKWKLSTVKQSNQKGEWFGWKIDQLGLVKETKVIEASRTFAQQVSKDALLLTTRASEAAGGAESPF